METKEPLLRSDWTILSAAGPSCSMARKTATLADSILDQVGGNAVVRQTTTIAG